MPVYAAREDPDPTTTARTITDLARAELTPLDEAGQVLALVPAAARPGDLVLMLGAGDVVETTPALLEALDAAARGQA